MLVRVHVVGVVFAHARVAPGAHRNAGKEEAGQHAHLGKVGRIHLGDDLLQVCGDHGALLEGLALVVGLHGDDRLGVDFQPVEGEGGDVVFGHVVPGGVEQLGGHGLGAAGQFGKVEGIELDDVPVAAGIGDGHPGGDAGGFQGEHLPRSGAGGRPGVVGALADGRQRHGRLAVAVGEPGGVGHFVEVVDIDRRVPVTGQVAHLARGIEELSELVAERHLDDLVGQRRGAHYGLGGDGALVAVDDAVGRLEGAGAARAEEKQDE